MAGALRFNPDDEQQFDLYDAEHAVHRHRDVKHYQTRQEAMALIERITSSPEWRALRGPSSVKVTWTRHDSGIATCYQAENKICLPGWAYNAKTIVHELAHLVTTDGHGPAFAGTALMLYRKFITIRFAEAMQASYDLHGVKYKRRRFTYRKG